MPSASLSVAGGTLRISQPVEVTEMVEPGLKLALILSGQLTYRLPRARDVCVRGPEIYISLTDAPSTIWHQFDPTLSLQYVTVFMPAEALGNAFGLEVDQLSRQLCLRGKVAATSRGLAMDHNADRVLAALGRQMLLCPLRGTTRNIYLMGKALELAASAIDALEQQPRKSQGSQLVSNDVRHLHEARDILRQRLQAPPGLPELARLVGTNVQKLTSGFRQLFGMSVYDFVREQRLELAYRLLEAGEICVTQAADACGYTHSHFTKVFRKRFGVAPSTLR